MSRLGLPSQRYASNSSALDLNGTGNTVSPAASAATNMSFRMQDEDLAGHAVMNTSFTSSRSNDLLMQDMHTSQPLQIDFDQNVFMFEESRLPRDIGRALALSPGAGLHPEFGTQVLDLAPELRNALPVGNHDLVAGIHLDLRTNYRKPFVVEFKTVYALGNEFYYGNSYDPSNKTQATNTVSFIVRPTSAQSGVDTIISLPVIDRKITQPMLQFLARFPNQTADTIDEYCTVINEKEVLLHYSPIANVRPTSCVSLWHAAYQPIEGEMKATLQENANGMASMSRKLYDALAQQAKGEISRHISLGDVTSSKFTVEIRPLPVNNSTDTPHLGAFEAQYPGEDKSLMVEDKYGRQLTIGDLFEKTPIEFSGKVSCTYRKINDGK